MKTRILLTSFFLLLSTASTFAAANGGTALPTDVEKFSTALASGTVSATHTPAVFRAASNYPSHSGNEPGATCFRMAPDIAIHGSVTHSCSNCFCLLATLSQQPTDAFPLTVNPTTQQVFYRVLFRVIISPNAP